MLDMNQSGQLKELLQREGLLFSDSDKPEDKS